jgi:acyl-coenzyme A thioesterase PaaI-like protein
MNSELLRRIMDALPADAGMQLPPKVFLDMKGEFIEFVQGEKLVARFPNMERYENPLGFMQGGIIVAAMDNTVSPLGYMLSPANITAGIEAIFKRPIKRMEPFIDVVATVVERSN